jgi:hypothetical protein
LGNHAVKLQLGESRRNWKPGLPRMRSQAGAWEREKLKIVVAQIGRPRNGLTGSRRKIGKELFAFE